MSRVILFTFYGRRENIELQLPYLRRIIQENPEIEVHLWDLCRNETDHEYVQSITGERITVRSDYYGGCAWTGFNDVWRHYTNRKYADALFVKLDDDVVFIETKRFGTFIDTIDQNRGSVISAKTVNNGASTRLEHGLWKRFTALNIPLLDVHESADYARASHDHFCNWDMMIGQPIQAFPTDDWLSINLIGMDHPTLCAIADALGTRSPRIISGRDCKQWPQLGDEGAANTLPRLILQGFTASHLSFGPQQIPDTEWSEMRRWYKDVAEEYLS